MKLEVAAGSGVSFRPYDTAIVLLAVSEVVVQVAFIGRALTTQTRLALVINLSRRRKIALITVRSKMPKLSSRDITFCADLFR